MRLYSLLRAMLQLHENIDISKYAKVKSFLKSQSHGYRTNQLVAPLRQLSKERWTYLRVWWYGKAGLCDYLHIALFSRTSGYGDMSFLLSRADVAIHQSRGDDFAFFLFYGPSPPPHPQIRIHKIFWIFILFLSKILQTNSVENTFFLECKFGKFCQC